MLSIDLNKYAFRDVSIHLVPSVPGRFNTKQNFHKYGLNRIQDILKKNPPSQKQDYMVTYQTTSVGKITEDFLITFYSAFGLINEKIGDL